MLATLRVIDGRCVCDLLSRNLCAIRSFPIRRRDGQVLRHVPGHRLGKGDGRSNSTKLHNTGKVEGDKRSDGICE